MTIALPASPARRGLGVDLSKPVLIAFAVILFFLIAMPLSWLVLYAFSTKSGAFTLDNFHRLLSDAAFLDPLLTTFALATLSAVICCIVAAPMGWLVARTDMPLRRTVRLLVTASFVTPPFLGAIACIPILRSISTANGSTAKAARARTLSIRLPGRPSRVCRTPAKPISMPRWPLLKKASRRGRRPRPTTVRRSCVVRDCLRGLVYNRKRRVQQGLASVSGLRH